MRILFILTVFLIGFNGSARADSSPWSNADHVRGKILSAVNSVKDVSAFDAAVQIKLSEGWHTYWRVPGDAGLAPVFDWSGSRNIESTEVSWPAPMRKDENGFQTFAYLGEVTFPVSVSLQNPGELAKLSLNMDVMVCNEICIPQKLSMHLDIPAIGEARSGEVQLIDYAKRKIPAMDNIPQIKIDTIVTSGDAVVVSAYIAAGFEKADIFVSADGYGFTAPIEITPDANDERKAMIKIPAPSDIENLNDFLDGKTLNVVLVSGKDAVEKSIAF